MAGILVKKKNNFLRTLNYVQAIMKRKPSNVQGLKNILYQLRCHNYAFQCHNHMLVFSSFSDTGFPQRGSDMF